MTRADVPARPRAGVSAGARTDVPEARSAGGAADSRAHAAAHDPHTGTGHDPHTGTGHDPHTGTAHGAITIINATATGRGCALAIDAQTTAHWTARPDGWTWHGVTDDALAKAVHAIIEKEGGNHGASASCATPFPPSRGLKTSSAAATAMLRAAAAANGIGFDADRVDALAVQAARDAGVTLTGAFDDQCAVSRGGCHLTDNHEGRIIASFPVPAWHVAVWVPDGGIRKASVADVSPAPARAGAQKAEALLRAGNLPGAMTRNGEAFHDLYAAAGLPVTTKPVQVALAGGALGAGLSGTGPAVAAIFDARVALPPVAGGEWRWCKAVPE